jgi:phosphohistidine swiveling domain-containing protein
MSAPFPIDPHLDQPFYLGAALPLPGPVLEEGIELFRKEDESRFWMIEGHWSRGFKPLTISTAGDVLWGTQYGAAMYQLPPTKGQAARMTGVHCYVSDIPCCSGWEVEHRAAAVEGLVGPAIMNFPALWATRLGQLVAGLAHFESADLSAMGMTELAVYLTEAWTFHRWAWEMHFEIMDPLIGNYMAFKGLCAELGVAEADVSRLLQGRPTMIMETDRQLWVLAVAARDAGIADRFEARSPTDTLAALRASASEDGIAGWLVQLDEFVQQYGWRTEGMCDPGLAPWVEDPTPVIGLVAGFLRAGSQHDFDAAAGAATGQRDETVARIHAQLEARSGEEGVARFDAGLAACEHANFAWWQEEHNFYLDLRVHIPIRRAAIRLGELVAADHVDDGIYLFRHEIDDVVHGRVDYETLRPTVAARRTFYAQGLAKRAAMPAVLGTPVEGGDDPVIKEIFGIDARLVQTVSEVTADTTEFTGVPASSGCVTGRARVIVNSDGLWELEDGEILVCVFTSPNWTPAFAQIAGCVADSGGSLSHTAIVAREYRVPAVVGTGVATRLIRTGDLVELDGDVGSVRIVQRG